MTPVLPRLSYFGCALALALFLTALFAPASGSAQVPDPPPAVESSSEASPSGATASETRAPTTSADALSAEQDAPPPPPIREKVYYVPFEELKEVFEAADRGLFLPYEEFLELWRKAEGREPKRLDPPPAPTVIRGGQYRGTVGDGSARFTARYSVEALAGGWTETRFLLGMIALESATISVAGVENTEALFVARNGAYSLLLPREGTYEIDLVFSVPVVEQPGKKSVQFGIPSVAVSKLDLTIPEEDLRVEVEPVLAATATESVAGTTEVHAFLGDSGSVIVSWMPPAGRAADGGAIVSAHQEALASLDERVLRLASMIEFAVLRGEVDTFRIALPAGLQLFSVLGENLKEWSAEDGVLTVTLHAAVRKSYVLAIQFERILDGTPPTISIPFPSAMDVQRESGAVAFEHDPALRVRVTARERLSQLDPEEIPQNLRAPGRTGYSYLETPVSLALEVEKIEPQVRSETVSVITLGTNEDHWVGWVDATITRAGLFQISLRIPAGWEVDSIGDPSVIEEFQVTDGADGRTVQVSLRSRALGAFRLPFRFVREGTARAGDQTVSPPIVIGSEQDRGILGVSAPRAFEVVTGTTAELTDTDVDELFRTGILGQIRADTAIPRAFRYRKHPASAQLTLTVRRTEIDLLAQHLIDVGDGEIRITHLLDHEILYAAVDSIRFRAPSILDDSLTVEAKQKTQVRKLSTENGMTTWEVGLQPPALGSLTVSIHHTLPLPALVAGAPQVLDIPLIEAVGTRGTQGFVAIRKEGTLEVVAEVTEMEGIDAGDLPDKLRRGRIANAFRYFNPEPKIALELTRYDHETLATAVVSLMRLRSVVSQDRQVKTEAVLWMQNSDRQFLELELPRGSTILTLAVNGRSQSPKKRTDGSGTLIEIPRSAGPAGTFPVVVVYGQSIGGPMGSIGSMELETPRVLADLPVHEIELDLYLPAEFKYLGWGGNLHRRSISAPTTWERFKGRIGLPTARGGNVTPASRDERVLTNAVTIELPTEGKLHERFETLSPTGRLKFRYYGNTFFGFLDFILFAGAALATWVMIEHRVRSKPAGAAVLIFLSLTYYWFSHGPAQSFAASVFFGVISVCGFFALRAGRVRWKHYRAERWAMAPDPYLEQAGAPVEKKDPKPRRRKRGDPAEDASPETSPADAGAESAENAKEDEEATTKKTAKKAAKKAAKKPRRRTRKKTDRTDEDQRPDSPKEGS